jgi:hypothetical protein
VAGAAKREATEKDIEVDGRYRSNVSGTLAVVRVVEVNQIRPAFRWPNCNWRTVIYSVNEATGRRITVRSPQRPRPLPAMACAFCRHAFNRADGELVCPYCGKRLPGA